MKKRFLHHRRLLWGLFALFGITACLLLGAADPGTKGQGWPQPVSARTAHYERVMAEFEQGNFSAFSFEEGDYPSRNALERSWQIGVENEGRTGVFHAGNTFARVDLNGDGWDELVWSEAAEAGKGVHRILGIFRYERGWMKEVVWDDVYVGWFYFLCPNGNIVERGYYFGTYEMEQFEHIVFDQDWRPVTDYGLSIWEVYSMDELLENWAEVYPDMNAVGFYFKKKEFASREDRGYARGTGRLMTAEAFRQEFRDLTGLDINGVSEVWRYYTDHEK